MTIGKPGIWIPFGIMLPLDRLPEDAAGGLLKALLEYGELGEVSHVPDQALPLWMVLSSQIQLDDVLYSMRSFKTRYQTYLRYMAGTNEPVLSFDAWMDAYGKYTDDATA